MTSKTTDTFILIESVGEIIREVKLDAAAELHRVDKTIRRDIETVTGSIDRLASASVTLSRQAVTDVARDLTMLESAITHFAAHGGTISGDVDNWFLKPREASRRASKPVTGAAKPKRAATRKPAAKPAAKASGTK